MFIFVVSTWVSWKQIRQNLISRKLYLQEVKEILDDPSEVSNDSLIGLEQRGCNLKPRPDVESGLSRLRGLRMTMDQWETRAASCLQVCIIRLNVYLQSLISLISLYENQINFRGDGVRGFYLSVHCPGLSYWAFFFDNGLPNCSNGCPNPKKSI